VLLSSLIYLIANEHLVTLKNHKNTQIKKILSEKKKRKKEKKKKKEEGPFVLVVVLLII
jgi:hypothetical protein